MKRGYTSDGRFPNSAKNALNHTASTTYDGRFGNSLIKTDANGQQKEMLYDLFGQRYNEKHVTPDEDEDSQEVYEKLWCDDNPTCPEYAVFFVRGRG